MMYTYKYTNHLYFCLLFYRTYLCHCADFLGAAEEITTKGVPDLLEGDKNSHSEQYPTLSRPTFSVYYKTVFTELITCVKGIQPGKQCEDREVRGVQCKRGMSIGWGIVSHSFSVGENVHFILLSMRSL